MKLLSIVNIVLIVCSASVGPLQGGSRAWELWVGVWQAECGQSPRRGEFRLCRLLQLIVTDCDWLQLIAEVLLAADWCPVQFNLAVVYLRSIRNLQN